MRGQDVQQAEALLDILWQRRPHELKLAWEEANKKGSKWRQPLIEGMGELTPHVRDGVLKTIGQLRKFITGLDLTFSNAAPHYDFTRDTVTFPGNSRNVSTILRQPSVESKLGCLAFSAVD
jgi:hypothetical protein